MAEIPEIIDGPGAPDFDVVDAVPMDQMGFAWHLQRELYRLGVRMAALDTTLIRAGERIQVAPEWAQLNVRTNIPAKLAAYIFQRFGERVQFGTLIMPSKGVEVAEWQCSNDVWVRHLIAYRILRDDFQQRWDVLVRSAK